MNAVFSLSEEYLDPTVLLCKDPDPNIVSDYLFGFHLWLTQNADPDPETPPPSPPERNEDICRYLMIPYQTRLINEGSVEDPE
jgi:hypothetical protein